MSAATWDGFAGCDGWGSTGGDCGNTGMSGVVVIPSTYNGLPVTSIAVAAFAGNPNITSVIIPDSVTNIGDRAFQYCGGLTNRVSKRVGPTIDNPQDGWCEENHRIGSRPGQFIFTRFSVTRLGVAERSSPIAPSGFLPFHARFAPVARAGESSRFKVGQDEAWNNDRAPKASGTTSCPSGIKIFATSRLRCSIAPTSRFPFSQDATPLQRQSADCIFRVGWLAPQEVLNWLMANHSCRPSPCWHILS